MVGLGLVSYGLNLSGQHYLDKRFGIEGSVSIPLLEYEDIRLMGQDSMGHLYLQSDTDANGAGAATLIKLDSEGEIIEDRILLSTDRTLNFHLKNNTIYSKNNLAGSVIIDALHLDLQNKSRHVIPEEFVSNVHFFPDNSILGITSRVASDIVTVFKYKADGSLDINFGKGGLIEIYEEEAYSKFLLHTNDQLYILTSKYPSAERVMLRRYDETGQIDNSLGAAGALKLDIQLESITSSLLRSMTELNDGSFLASYILYDQDFTNYLAYAKYDEDGDQDLNFGINGYLGVLHNIGEFGYTSRFITQTDDDHLLFHYTIRDSITNLKTEFLSLYDKDGNKLESFADNGVFELSDLPDYIQFNVSTHGSTVYIDYEMGRREEGKPFESTHHVLSKLDLQDHLEDASSSDTDEFKIYPNPFSKSLTIENYRSKIENAEINIYDILGQKEKQFYYKDIPRYKFIIDLPNLASGIHLIQIVIGDTIIQTEKVMRY